MNDMQRIDTSGWPAVIYTRVSSDDQLKGNGLQGQEYNCRRFAEYQKHFVEEVFCDEGISGGVKDRPGMNAMIAFLKKSKGKRYVVIVDDISRWSRDMRAHLELKETIENLGAVLIGPNFDFSNDASGILNEQMQVSFAEYYRRMNRERVLSRQLARIKAGYYIFGPIFGYEYADAPGGGRVLVPQEPNASLMREAIEGLASGRFQTAVEVKRFFDLYPSTRRRAKKGISPSTVHNMFRNPLYAGYFNVKKWKIVMQKGVHEPLVSLETWQRALDRLNGNCNAPARIDINQEFPLRGSVKCSECHKPMTSAFARGRNKHYPYYYCRQKSCSKHRKSYKREDVEAAFLVFIRKLKPRPALLKVARSMFEEIWEQRQSSTNERKDGFRAQLGELETKIESLVERIVATDNSTLLSAYENQLEKLEKEKLLITENIEKTRKPAATFQDLFQTAWKFLSNPCNLWEYGDFAHRRLVLRLAFPEGVIYCPDGKVRTAVTAWPFKAFERFCTPKREMVEGTGFEPVYAMRADLQSAGFNHSPTPPRV